MSLSQPDQTCPNCGGTLEFRLGEYECNSCGYSQSATKQDDTPASSGPGFRRERWNSGTSPNPPSVAETPPRGTVFRSTDDPSATTTRPDFSPTGSMEKMILLGVFIVKSITNIAVAGTGVDGGIEAVLTQIGVEIVTIGVIVAVFYIPWAWSKGCCAVYTCANGVLALGSLLLGAIVIPMAGWLVPMGGLAAFMAWLVGLFNAGVNLWVASVLFRDMQQIQAR